MALWCVEDRVHHFGGRENECLKSMWERMNLWKALWSGLSAAVPSLASWLRCGKESTMRAPAWSAARSLRQRGRTAKSIIDSLKNPVRGLSDGVFWQFSIKIYIKTKKKCLTFIQIYDILKKQKILNKKKEGDCMNKYFELFYNKYRTSFYFSNLLVGERIQRISKRA